jgi:putative transposon-encoded protein
MYIRILRYVVRRMKANITRIESTVTPSGNSGHVVVPKTWIGKESIVKLKEKENVRVKYRHGYHKSALNYEYTMYIVIFIVSR